MTLNGRYGPSLRAQAPQLSVTEAVADTLVESNCLVRVLLTNTPLFVNEYCFQEKLEAAIKKDEDCFLTAYPMGTIAVLKRENKRINGLLE